MRCLPQITLAAVAAIASFAGCNQIIGLDPGLDKPTGTGGAGGSSSSSSSGTTSGGGQGGTGGAPLVCKPGETQLCYTGPDDTAGVGQCHPGSMTCALDGSAFGACEGEVLPGVEACNTPGDEDCDGVACSDVVWADLFGDTAAQAVTAVAVDGGGNTLAVGTLAGSAAFGSTPLLSAGSNDVFVTKIDPAGQVLWALRTGDNQGQSVSAVATNAAGNVYLAGHFNGVMAFDPTTLTSAGGLDIYAARLGPDGSTVWAVRFGDAANQHINGAATTPEGDLIIAGDFLGSFSLGGTMLQNPNAAASAFVARLSGASGSPVWARSYADANGAAGTVAQAVAVDASGDIVVGGTVSGTTSFGGQTISGAPGKNTYLLKLDAAGDHVWSKGFSAAQSSPNFKITSVAAAPDGSVTIAGPVGGGTDFGGGPTGTGGLYVARFDAGGAYQWNRMIGGTSGSTVVAAVDAAGEVAVTGGYLGIISFGAGMFTNTAAMTNVFLAKLDPQGEHLWSKAFASAGPDDARGIALDPTSQRIVIGGRQTSATDYGTGALTPAGGGDAFVAAFQP